MDASLRRAQGCSAVAAGHAWLAPSRLPALSREAPGDCVGAEPPRPRDSLHQSAPAVAVCRIGPSWADMSALSNADARGLVMALGFERMSLGTLADEAK